MDISSSFFTTSTRCYVPSPDMVLLKKVGVSQCYQGSGVSMFVSLSQSLVLKHKKYPVQVLCSQKKEITIVEARIRRKPMQEEEGSVYAPSFDHGVGDPVEDDIFVNVQHKVVIVEGNYILLEDGTWKEVSSMFDEKWFVDVDINIAMERVLKRHIGTGNTPELAKQRIEYNDRPNAELVYKSKKNADLIIKSVAL